VTIESDLPQALSAADCREIVVGPGCIRRDAPAIAGVRSWFVEMAPGSTWPHVDHHDAGGEVVYVLEGELIEGNRRFAAGTMLIFPPNSSHQPRTEVGVRLFGFNPPASPLR
jgi:anti-sigma factor ChrR (cupin superfamily)